MSIVTERIDNMHFYQFSELHHDMVTQKQCMEQFYVTFAGVKFDVIFDISNTPYELLIGAVNKNWACTLKMEKGYQMVMPDNVFWALKKLLNLKAGKEALTSFKFLKHIADNAPPICSNKLVEPYHLVPFRKDKIKKDDEPEKTVSIGWNNHLRDKRTAHNFDKTEKYLGKVCADYCRKNNISSLWTYPSNATAAKPAYYPWEDL